MKIKPRIKMMKAHKNISESPTVVIVEDSTTIKFIYKEMFNSIGFNIIGMASNGQEAVQLINNLILKPDFLVLDYKMPFKNGFEVLEEIRDTVKSTKFIMTSADISIQKLALKFGVYKFLDKSFRLEVLKEIYREFMNH